MRIALFHNLHSGGAKRVVAQQTELLSRRHDVTIFSMKNADHHFAENSFSVKIPVISFDENELGLLKKPFGRINPVIRLVNLRRLEIAEEKAAARINEMNFDVVLIHPCQVTQTPLVLKYLRTPSVYYCNELPRRLYEPPVFRPYMQRSNLRRGLDLIDPWPRIYDWTLKRIDRNAAVLANGILTNSYFTRGKIRAAYGVDAKVCYPGVKIQVSDSPSASRERFVLSVGALTPLKGFDFIIKALGSQTENTRVPLVIVSNYQEPDEFAYLHNLASKVGVQVDFRKGIPDNELQDLYRRAGCVVCAPISEPLGLTPLEAMATGAAVIGVNEGGVSETIIDGQTGRLSPRDPLIFGQMILELVDHPWIARKLGEEAESYIREKWTWDRHLDQLEDELREVIHTQLGAMR